MKKYDVISAYSHLIYACFSIFLFFLLIIKGLKSQNHYALISYIIFSFLMTTLYLSSGIYHLIPNTSPKKKIFKKIDHIMIFFMIAGTYTPFCLITLIKDCGWLIFVIIWTLAIAGLFFKMFWINAPRLLYTTIYIIMGWVIVGAIFPLYRNLPGKGLFWLVAGGLFYTVGAVIYMVKKPNFIPDFFGFHEIWHFFVIFGTLCHYIAIYFYT
jgi:hemolysin III